ncbi:MAG TPA: hypothetical protein PJ991_00065 [Kiritimatiellia bacterium]|nr:hypothetical protein [Kiritimatiellia bacterium]
MLKPRYFLVASGLMTQLMFIGCAPPATEPTATKTPTVPVKVADNAMINRLDGGDGISLSGTRSKPAMVYIFGSWTDSSDASVAWLKSFPRDTMDVIPVIVDINIGADQKFAIQSRLGDLPVYQADAATIKALGSVRALPTAILLGVDGKVRNKWEGYVPVDVVMKDLLQPTQAVIPIE